MNPSKPKLRNPADRAKAKYQRDMDLIRKKKVAILKTRYQNYYKGLDQIGNCALMMDIKDNNRNLPDNPIKKSEII